VSAAIYYLTKGSGPLHLVLTDMRMPTVSGRCILSAMRGSLKHVPVIVMTAFATPTLREECTALGASAFLEKPFDIRKLSEVISSVIEPKPTVEPD
jgi:DNA-binding NtrC family response regulator